MRFALLASALTLAACSADDCGSGASCAPLPFPDARPADLGAADTGADVGQVDTGSLVDVGAEMLCDPAINYPCICGDGSRSDRVCQVFDGRYGPCRCPGAGPRDAGALDVGTDSGSDVGALDVGAVDVGTNPGPADVGTDVGPADTGRDVPPDVRIDCAPIGLGDIPCRSHADCAACIPGAFNSIWCCAASGVCGNTSNPTCN
ncbi:MAG: hypothetical protein Q8S73_20190 [Deltaproteobacteria bacterium]|nr:hypothetical protein [Myxococcales bacterium]MDP3216439.1 hypothetical protein [Deltaproteobacteria bacterium]